MAKFFGFTAADINSMTVRRMLFWFGEAAAMTEKEGPGDGGE